MRCGCDRLFRSKKSGMFLGQLRAYEPSGKCLNKVGKCEAFGASERGEHAAQCFVWVDCGLPAGIERPAFW